MLTGYEFLDNILDYHGISQCIRNCSKNEIASAVAEIMNIENIQQLYDKPFDLHLRNGSKALYGDLLDDLSDNIYAYDWLYDRLRDSISQNILRLITSFRLIPDRHFIEAATTTGQKGFLDTSIMTFDENEVVIDLATCEGKVAYDFVNIYPQYKKYYYFESISNKYQKVKKKLKCYNDIVFYNKSGIHLDADVTEPITCLILDSKQSSVVSIIIGAKNHIKNDTPKLAIPLNNGISDIWEIPRIIDSISPNYKFFIRHYKTDNDDATILYAIPPTMPKRRFSLMRAAAIVPYSDNPWNNAQLTKDCGLVPYLFHKMYNMDVSMVGISYKSEDYPSSSLVDGLELVALRQYNIEEKLNYLKNNAHDIDLLILLGAYPDCQSMAVNYKQWNPYGMIYCGLDANSFWMDRIQWADPYFQKFLDAVDVLATSCSVMAGFLSKKWHRSIHCITNGYYSFLKKPRVVKRFSEKKNVILTVGRLGTKQKATHILLEAFAKIAKEIPDWSLRLVGTVEKNFEPIVTDFYRKFPQLKERVVFVGQIIDKDALVIEYENAKIFTLSSIFEGGSPNVIGEALTAGCVCAVTRFDAYSDCIASGKCGISAEIGDPDDLAEGLRTLCQKKELETMSEYARSYASEFYNMEKNVSTIYNLLKESYNDRRE